MKVERKKISIIFSWASFLLVLGLALSIFAFASAYAEESSQFKPGFHLKVTGGLSQSTIGDMNTHLSTMHDFYARQFGNLASGEIKALNSAREDVELEFMWDLSRKFRLGLGTSIPTRYRKESAWQSPDPQNPQMRYEITVEPEIKAWRPVKLSVYYSICHGEAIDLRAYTGVSFYSTKMSEDKTFRTYYVDGTMHEDGESLMVDRATRAGWHGGLSLEYGVVKNLSIVADIEGCLMRNSSMKGSELYYYNYPSEGAILETGALYFVGSSETYYDLMIGEPIHLDAIGQEPPGYVERKARLDLSGFSFRLGLRLRLF
ncbi:MAG: hypothetical protein GYA53_07860 [Acidobacteria bacterium]|nr:hypothetical protein [Acidobacteriota bacterium]